MVFLLSLGFCNIVFAMDDSEVVDSFKQYVDDAMTQVSTTYDGTHYSMTYEDYDGFKPMKEYVGWYKTTNFLEPGYKIDVQKTTSLISPYIGKLEVKINHVTFLTNKNKDIAEAEKLVNTNCSNMNTYIFAIAFQNGIWNVTSVRSDYGELNPDSILNILRCKDKIRK